jgi:hypothetical protein
MRIIVEVVAGTSDWKKTVMRAGQSLRFGRTELADVAFPQDNCMSGVHFLLETDQRACYVQDLGSRNGTFLNGRQIAERTALENRDELIAGQTTFQVRFDDDNPLSYAEMSVTAPLPRPPIPTRAFVPPPLPPLLSINYSIERCASGLTLCRGAIDEIPPAELAVRLSRILPVYLIVDFKHLGIPLPEELSTPAYLFDWLDPAAKAAVSPVIVTQDDFPAWPTLIERGWGNDAVICLFSALEKSTILNHLRSSCRNKSHRPDVDAGILGYCWPKVLAPLLAHYTPGFVKELLTGIDAVLVELPDQADSWQFFGGSRAVELMEKLGLREKSPPQEPPRD